MTASASTAPRTPSHAALPRIALQLGYAGLAPFVLGALLVWIVNAEAHPYATLALASYAAVIVSFLGGIHWGIAFRDPGAPDAARQFVWGIVPSLVAWLAVMMPASAGLVIHGVMLVVCYLVDRRLYPRHGLADWLVLRFRLSAVAAASCFLGAAGT